MNRLVRVLVVDDSPLFVDTISRVLEAEGDIVVVGTGRDGREAVSLVDSVRPDLVVMDVRMPVMDGLEAVERIMSSRPTPILLLTGDPSSQGARGSLEALSRGALDLVPKQVLGDEAQRAWLREHVRLLAGVTVVYRPPRMPRAASPRLGPAPAGGGGGVGLVGSTGGAPVIAEILAGLPRGLPLPVLVVQHLAPGFAPRLAEWLADSTRLPVHIAESGMKAAPGNVYLAPDGAHLAVGDGDRLLVDRHLPPVDGHRPSGTHLLSSMAAAWGRRAIGVVLTGMGSDGAAGLLAIHRAGGVTIAQDEATSAVFGMPRAARDLGAAGSILPAPEIPRALCAAAERLDSGRRKEH